MPSAAFRVAISNTPFFSSTLSAAELKSSILSRFAEASGASK
jgi:hypothetical protein